MSSCYLHVDLDAFFASVEQLDNPEYRGKAVIVGGLPSDKRSVVSTCSYEARKYGVHSAMPTAKAYKLCPNGIYLRGRMERYHEKSREVMKIFYDFSPDVKQMSVDEAFIDITGTEMLFGPPEEVAKKLKKEVFEKTGLTVSVGVAYNKYIAKIASGINKPDGLCFVPEGKEEEFMLNLPLSKLWGAGTKTQTKLKSYGFYTTKDIHKTSLQNLITLFGNCTGSFLYNAVRGKEVETFSDNVKSHSISAEETYSYDITDIFTIETALLKLCYEVRFRLLDEGWHSKTLHVKIRYEDFTTVSVQSTYKRAFASLDDMYEKVCNLFKSKYNFGKGIRLLGVGAQNLEKGSNSAVPELFDFGEEKKQKIEEAVLNLQKKNPKSEIKKARQFIKKGMFLFFLMINLGFAQKSFGNQILEATNSEKETELYVEGEWEASLKQSITFSFQNKDSYVEVPPIVFKQKAALSVFFMYDKKWYFEAVFQDGFENNKLVAGYQNQSEKGIFTEIKVGNKDIFLTSNYGGENFGQSFSNGENTTFGAKALVKKEFSTEKKIQGETFVRIDNLETFSKTWEGNYLRTNKEIELNSYIANKYFYLPFYTENIQIFSQNENGKFEKIDNQDFLFYQRQNQLAFKYPLKNQTAIQIDNKNQIEKQLLDFIKSGYEWFSENEDFTLENYLGYLNIDFSDITEIENLTTSHIQHFFTRINEKDCLWLYKSDFVTLFENKNIFSVKISNLDNIELISKSAQIPLSIKDINFSTNQDENLILSYNFLTNPATSTLEKIIKSLFPLGNLNPEIYFVPKLAEQSDIAISIENYSLEENYNIGTKAEANSVVAYVNGFLTPCQYDKNSGNVIFQKKPSSNDTVQVFWKEHSKTESPTLFSALGFLVDFTPNLSLETFVAFNQPILWEKESQDVFKNLENHLQSNLEAGATLAYEKNFEKSKLSINNSSKIQYTNFNVLGKELIYESNNEEIGTKNYFQYDSIIQGTGNVSQIKNQNYKLIANLPENADFAEVSFFLPKNSYKLYESEGFILDTKISSKNILDLYNIYLEIGNLEDENARWNLESITTLENQGLSTEIRGLYFPITDLQKSKLGNGEKAKLIFEKKDENLANNIDGFLEIDSIEYVKTGFIPDSGVEIKNHLFQGQSGEKISIPVLEGKSEKSIKKYISPLPVNNYEEMIFEIFLPKTNDDKNFKNIQLKIQLLSLLQNGEYEVAFSKNFSLDEIETNQWENLKLSFENKKNSRNPNLLKITVENTGVETVDLDFCLGKIYLSGAKKDFLIADIFDFSYNFNENIFINTEITTNFKPQNENIFGNIHNTLEFVYPLFSFQNQIIGNFDSENPNIFDFEKTSHKFSTRNKIFDFIQFSEEYVFGNEESSVLKFNSLTFDFTNIFPNFPIKLTNEAKIDSFEVSQNENEFSHFKNSSSNHFFTEIKYPKYHGKFSLNVEQKSNSKDNKIIFDNYFKSYFNSLYYQILQNDYLNYNFKEDKNQKFQKKLERSETISLEQNLQIFNFSPIFSVGGENNFSETSEYPIIQNIQYKITLPFKIGKNSFSVSYGEKAISESETYIFQENDSVNFPKDYNQDFKFFFKNSALFSLILPTNNNGHKIQKITLDSNKISGSSKNQQVAFSWNRNIFSNLWDLLVPVGFSADFGNNFKASKSNFIQDYNFLGKVSFSAINLFGRDSSLELFNWYSFEEIVSNFSANYVKDKWNFAFNNGINIFLSETNSLSSLFESKITLNESFSIFESVIWSRLGKTAYLLPLIRIFYEDFTAKKIIRKESFSFSLENDHANSKKTFTGDFSHSVSVFVTDFASINTEIYGNMAKTQQEKNEKTTLEFSITLSGKLIF